MPNCANSNRQEQACEIVARFVALIHCWRDFDLPGVIRWQAELLELGFLVMPELPFPVLTSEQKGGAA